MSQQTRTNRIAATTMAIMALSMSATQALAHHPLGGETPATFWHGFLSGIGHPMIGLDHFAFIVAAGIAAAFLANRLGLIAAFIGATIVGCLLKVGLGLALPAAEFVIAASVIAVGVIAMSDKPVSPALAAGLFTVAGLFHGGAYGGAIVGAEMTPLTAYLTGFGLIQAGVMAVAMATTRALSESATAISMKPRFAGAVVAGVGATFLVEHLETLLLPAAA